APKDRVKYVSAGKVRAGRLTEMTPGAFSGAKTARFGANAWKCEGNMYFSLAIASKGWYNRHIIKHQCPFFFHCCLFYTDLSFYHPMDTLRRKVASA
ncbi:MAG: hypothetical protein RR452_00760, partial [Clostridia bacterium]